MWRRNLAGSVLSIGALLALGLDGCGVISVAGAAQTQPATVSAMPAITATPTGAATAMPTTVEPAMPALTPASSAGWSTYRDPRFGFVVPIALGWQSASLIWPEATIPSDYAGYVYYMVQFYPPGPHGEPGFGAIEKGPEAITILITLSAPTPSPQQGMGSSYSNVMSTVALGSQQVTLYGQWLTGAEIELELGVVTTIEHRPMNLTLHYMAIRQWDPTIAQRDVSVFLAMLKVYRPN